MSCNNPPCQLFYIFLKLLLIGKKQNVENGSLKLCISSLDYQDSGSDLCDSDSPFLIFFFSVVILRTIKSWHTKNNFEYITLSVPHLSTDNNAFKSPEDFKVSLPLRTNYLYGRIKKSLPEMYAFTVCMWLKSSASPGIGTPFSYGVPGQANEIVLIEWGNNPIELLVNDKVSLLW